MNCSLTTLILPLNFDYLLNEPDNSKKPRLNLNRVSIMAWFKQKYQEAQKQFDFSKKLEINKNKGIKM
jgi:hypothetical protein